MADEELHEADELGNEEHEGENKEAEEGVADDFANNVTIEDAHGATGECNMGRDSSSVDGAWPERANREYQKSHISKEQARERQELPGAGFRARKER